MFIFFYIIVYYFGGGGLVRMIELKKPSPLCPLGGDRAEGLAPGGDADL